MSTIHPFLVALVENAVEKRKGYYAEQAQIVTQEGLALLEEAKNLLDYYEGMPPNLPVELAHDLANNLRMKYVPELERSYVFFNDCLDYQLKRDFAEITTANAINKRGEEILAFYRSRIQELKAAFSSFPK